ncbi:hypothetical protein LZ30DRAFT_276254 [Colletotrichum cereale]|nr:hypothetical protein LZ30DRAFT_276254 [Colletotrichum cereale]
MLEHLNGASGPQAFAIPDGLEVNTVPNYDSEPHQLQPAQARPYYNQYQSTLEAKGKGRSTISGSRKLMYWLIALSVFLLCALIGITGGLGALIASKNSEIANLSSPTSSSSNSPNATVAVAIDLSKPAPTDTTISQTKCPDNISMKLDYKMPGTDLTFSKDCNMDYWGNDVANLPAKNFDECVRLCAFYALQPQKPNIPCKGVVYNYKESQGINNSYCWLKSYRSEATFMGEGGLESAWIQDS